MTASFFEKLILVNNTYICCTSTGREGDPLPQLGQAVPFNREFYSAFWLLHCGCFTLNVFLLSGDSQCSVALPHGAVSWPVGCDCGISRSYLFAFLNSTRTCMRGSRKFCQGVEF